MKQLLLSITWKVCALLVIGVVIWAAILHMLTYHAAWFTDVMFKKGGLHEMNAESLHALAVKGKWDLHRLHTFYLSIIAVLLAVIAVLSMKCLDEIDRSKTTKSEQ